jgi:hypothetical protein
VGRRQDVHAIDNLKSSLDDISVVPTGKQFKKILRAHGVNDELEF